MKTKTRGATHRLLSQTRGETQTDLKAHRLEDKDKRGNTQTHVTDKGGKHRLT